MSEKETDVGPWVPKEYEKSEGPMADARCGHNWILVAETVYQPHRYFEYQCDMCGVKFGGVPRADSTSLFAGG